MTVTETEPISPARDGLCEFPGVNCPNPKVQDAGASGRPPKYCGLEGPGIDGKLVIHNKATAWSAKKAAERRPVRAVGGAGSVPPLPAGPVTTARTTLENQMLELPRRLDQLQEFLTGITAAVRAYGDAEAVAAEVEQLQASSRAQVAEVERQRGEEEHRRRQAEQQAADAEDAREEADAAAQDAFEELESARAEALAALTAAEKARQDAVSARESAAAEVEQVHQEMQAAQEAATAQAEELRLDTERRIAEIRSAAELQIQQARTEVEVARIAQATAESERQTAQQTADQLRAELRELRDQHRAELESLRSEHRADRDQLRTDHQAQLADIRQAAADRVAAATTAQRLAEQTAEALRDQLTAPQPTSPPAEPETP